MFLNVSDFKDNYIINKVLFMEGHTQLNKKYIKISM